MRRLARVACGAAMLVPATAHAAPRVEVGADGRVLLSAGAGDVAGVDTLVTAPAPAAGQVKVQAQGATSDLEAGSGCTRDAGPPVSVTCASTGLFVIGSDFADKVTVQGAIAGEFEMAGGADVVDGGSAADKILGRDGGDTLNGGGGSDLIYPGGGDDVVDGGPGDEDLISLGDGDPNAPIADGADVVRDSGNSDKDVVSYFFAAGPIVLRADNGKADDGANGGAEGDAVQGGFERIIGSKGNDVMEAAPGGIKLNGSAGDDMLRGGPGVDKLEGNGGNDVLDSSGDGVRDTDLDCDAEQNLEGAKGTADKAIVDQLDVTPSNCEKVEKRAGAVKTPAGSFAVPEYAPVKNKSGRYRFRSVDKLERLIENAGAFVLLNRHPLAFNKVPRRYREGIDDRDIVLLKPRPGTKLSAAITKSARLDVYFYDEAQELDRFRSCPYKGDKSPSFRRALNGAPMGEAVDALERAKCAWRVARTERSGDVAFEQVQTANVGKNTSAATRYVWNLVVERPRLQVDFMLTLGARPQAEVRANPGLATQLAAEPALSSAGQLPITAPGQPATISVVIDNAPAGRAVRRAEVELYDADGRLVASQATGTGGARTLSAPFTKAGTARVVARVTDKRGRIAEGFASIKVADLAGGYFTMDGRYLKRTGNAFAPAPPPPPPPATVAAEAALDAIATELSKRGDPWARAAQILGSAGGTAADRLRRVDEELGIAHVKTTINGLLDAAVNPPPFARSAPAFIADADGNVVAGTNPAIGVPVGAGDIDGAALIGLDGATLIGMDGATLIGNDAGSLIGNDAGSLIGMDGATFAGLNAATAPLVSLGRTTLLAESANRLLPPGAAVISTGGNGLISDEGSGLVSDAGTGLTSPNNAPFRPGMALVPVSILG